MDDHATYAVDSETAATIRNAIDSLRDTELGIDRSQVSAKHLLYIDNMYMLMYVTGDVLVRLRFTRSDVYVAGMDVRDGIKIHVPETSAVWSTEKDLAGVITSMLCKDWKAIVDDIYDNKHIDVEDE